MPESLGAKIAHLSGVADVAPVLIVNAVGEGNLVIIDGIDYDRFAGLSNGFKFIPAVLSRRRIKCWPTIWWRTRSI